MSIETGTSQTSGKSETTRIYEKLSGTLSDGIKYYAYPNDLGTGQQGNFILFNIYVPETTEGQRVSGEGVYASQPIKGSRVVESSEVGLSNESVKGAVSAVFGEDISKNVVSYRKITRAIAMYMPNNFTFSDNFRWVESDFGLLGDLVGTNFGDTNTEKVMGALDFTEKGLIRTIRRVGELSTSLGAINVGGLLDKSLGTTLNPYREILFKGLDNRKFQFQFTMAPRNQKEAEMVANIVRLFRYHAHPSLGGGISTEDNLKSVFVYPSEFDITFYHHNKQNENLPRISTCALTNITYSPNALSGQYTTHADGSPVSMSIALQFTELEILTKERIAQGF